MEQEVYEKLSAAVQCREKMTKVGAQIQELHYRLLPSGIDYTKDRVQSSPSDQMAEYGARLDELSRTYEELCNEYQPAMERVRKYIDDNLEDHRMRLVLDLKYVSGLKWKDVAIQSSYAQSTVYKIHSQAIGILEEKSRAK